MSGSSRITDAQIIDLIMTKLEEFKELIPGLRNRPSDEVSPSEVLDEICNYIKELQGQVKDRSEEISDKLATTDSDTPQASTARSSIIPDQS